MCSVEQKHIWIQMYVCRRIDLYLEHTSQQSPGYNSQITCQLTLHSTPKTSHVHTSFTTLACSTYGLLCSENDHCVRQTRVSSSQPPWSLPSSTNTALRKACSLPTHLRREKAQKIWPKCKQDCTITNVVKIATCWKQV